CHQVRSSSPSRPSNSPAAGSVSDAASSGVTSGAIRARTPSRTSTARPSYASRQASDAVRYPGSPSSTVPGNLRPSSAKTGASRPGFGRRRNPVPRHRRLPTGRVRPPPPAPASPGPASPGPASSGSASPGPASLHPTGNGTVQYRMVDEGRPLRAGLQDRGERGVPVADLGHELGVDRARGQGQLGGDEVGQPPPVDALPCALVPDLDLPGGPGADSRRRPPQPGPERDGRPGQPADQVPVVLPGL